ncbi:DUF6527 family protein [Dokdonia sp. 4H-3-7-5]|uniref:DUF6527 family protein n=1 Tax=Dokdonia sp. (strain 4H-3-7-5) TaxID=983548 RepID=UPI00020A648B|nr:DUF6527 family protein [Dokdonia sp. 4H-3-7-5]AEE19460.1 hypothetical protein Krodi_1477 [Dokdonia sp. 4H-3-7-5]
MRQLFKKFISWLSKLLSKEATVTSKRGFNVHYTSEFPEFIDKNIIYVECNVKSKDYWYAKLQCPCGCEDVITLNLMDDVNPCWKLTTNEEEPSIYPSIWRTKNCESHFWLRSGLIVWAE